MKLAIFAGCALACVALSGCAAFQGLSAVNTALLPQLKPADIKIHTDTTCGGLAAAVNGLAGAQQLTLAQALAIVTQCEARDAQTTLTLDLQGGRKAVDGVISKAASPTAVVAKAVGAP